MGVISIKILLPLLDVQKKIAEKLIGLLEKKGLKIATQLREAGKFWQAEDYHQNYEKNNPNNPYVQKVSIPRLNRFKEKFPEILKEESH